MRITHETTDAKGAPKIAELPFYRDFASLPSGLGRITLNLRDDSDKDIAKANRETVARIFPGSGTATAKWTAQREFTVTTGTGSVRFILQSDSDSSQAERTFPSEPPNGHALTYTNGESGLVFEAKPVTVPAAPTTVPPVVSEKRDTAGDNLEALSDADLKTKLAEAGIYPKKYDRAKGLQALREKLQPAGV